ncbi:2-Hydroxyacid oxidase 1-like [Diadema antillarum]|uniref:2-Hydroxyacid oxidase 1-like n=1 Tax=Diadema antillarum TaxID=105358 RepID=UPI003A864C42
MAYVDEDLQKALSSGDEFLWAYSVSQLNSSVTWSSIRWLKSITDLPVVVKGILSGDMAREAVAAGADAILVSAHGARQLDGVITPLDALPEVVEAVRDTNTEVYLDGGIRTGMDAFRAIALGARAVFIGRPQLWGLASGGQQGVEEILDIIKDEFSRTMALTGCASISDIQPSLLVSESQLKSKL